MFAAVGKQETAAHYHVNPNDFFVSIGVDAANRIVLPLSLRVTSPHLQELATAGDTPMVVYSQMIVLFWFLMKDWGFDVFFVYFFSLFPRAQVVRIEPKEAARMNAMKSLAFDHVMRSVNKNDNNNTIKNKQ
jgi:hypothetical protein